MAGLIDGASEEAGVRIVAAVVADADADQLAAACPTASASKLSPAAVVLGGDAGGKAHLWRASTAARRSAASRPST